VSLSPTGVTSLALAIRTSSSMVGKVGCSGTTRAAASTPREDLTGQAFEISTYGSISFPFGSPADQLAPARTVSLSSALMGGPIGLRS